MTAQVVNEKHRSLGLRPFIGSDAGATTRRTKALSRLNSLLSALTLDAENPRLWMIDGSFSYDRWAVCSLRGSAGACLVFRLGDKRRSNDPLDVKAISRWEKSWTVRG